MQVDFTHLFLTDAARILRVSPRTLQRACARGEIPHIRVGPWIKVHVSVLGWEPPISKTGGGYSEEDTPLFHMKPVRVWRNSRKPVNPWAIHR